MPRNGYVILGLIIETVTAKPYANVVHDRIIEPLALSDTIVPLPEDESIPGDHMHGYEEVDGILLDVSYYNHSWAFAEGEMISNAQDLSLWLDKLLSGEVFVNSSTLNKMLDFVDVGDGFGYGLGLHLLPIDGVGHDGGTLGYTTVAYTFPETETINWDWSSKQ